MGGKSGPPPQVIQAAMQQHQQGIPDPNASFSQLHPGFTTGSMGGGWGGYAPNPGQAGPGQQPSPFVSNPYQQGQQGPSTIHPGYSMPGPMGSNIDVPAGPTTPGQVTGSMNNPFSQGQQMYGRPPPGGGMRPPAFGGGPTQAGGYPAQPRPGGMLGAIGNALQQGQGQASIQPWRGAQPTLFDAASGAAQGGQQGGSFNMGRMTALANALRGGR